MLLKGWELLLLLFFNYKKPQPSLSSVSSVFFLWGQDQSPFSMSIPAPWGPWLQPHPVLFLMHPQSRSSPASGASGLSGDCWAPLPEFLILWVQGGNWEFEFLIRIRGVAAGLWLPFENHRQKAQLLVFKFCLRKSPKSFLYFRQQQKMQRKNKTSILPEIKSIRGAKNPNSVYLGGK